MPMSQPASRGQRRTFGFPFICKTSRTVFFQRVLFIGGDTCEFSCEYATPPLFYNQACCPTLEPKVLQLDNKISDLKSLILVNTHFKVHSWLAKMLTVKHI